MIFWPAPLRDIGREPLYNIFLWKNVNQQNWHLLGKQRSFTSLLARPIMGSDRTHWPDSSKTSWRYKRTERPCNCLYKDISRKAQPLSMKKTMKVNLTLEAKKCKSICDLVSEV